MKILCIYHGNCADEFGVTWVSHRSLSAENTGFLDGRYGMPAPNVKGNAP